MIDQGRDPIRLSAVIPATNGPATLPECLAAIRAADAPPEQVIVVDDPSLNHPALARNAGARQAEGNILMFVDADVTVHADVFARIRRTFADDPGLAAVFGSYDDRPAARSVVSAFRNLLHHHVHQQGAGPAGTFWAGLGAMRREVFEANGGFHSHPIEDIELGMRVVAGGGRIRLDPSILGTHLKRWTLYSMVRTDLLIRGIPWVGLLISHWGTASTTGLNLGWRHRLSALASVGLLVAAVLRHPLAGLGCLLLLVALNANFYVLLWGREGPLRAAGGVLLHVVHHLVSVIAVPIGIVSHMMDRRRMRGSSA